MNTQKSKYGVHRTGLRALAVALAALPWLAAGPAAAGQLVYTPVNPSFGGNPLNGSYLLQKAQSGKSYPLPTDDLDFMNSLGIVAQTDNTLIFKKGDSYYSYGIDTGTLRLIDFNSTTGAGLESAGSLK
ncbi:curli assembly protein CsgF [Eoetvoesiella caeni]